MKIAFIHFWALRLRRGVETMVLSLANELAKNDDVEVHILTARQTQRPLVHPSSRVKIKQFPTFRYYEFLTIAPLYTLDLIRNRFDLVIVFFADFGEGLALQLAAPFVQPRLLLYLTFPYESAPHRYHAYQHWGFDERAALILADAEYTARRGREVLDRPVHVLPSGTDPERFRPNAKARHSLRKQLGFTDRDIVLLNVAALEKRKGVWRVIEALPSIRQQCSNIRYLILGEGSDRPRLEQKVADLNLTDTVIFAGTTADLPPYYNAADIFVMLSDSEAGSVACLEAMASGLPVVVSKAGGFSEVVNTSNGQIVNLDDPDEIRCAIGELVQDESLRRQLGAAGRRTVVQKYAWTRIAEQLLALCRSANTV